MMMIEVIPQEFFDGVPVTAAVSLDGELMSALDEAPAGAWLAQLLEDVDAASLTTFELHKHLRMCSRMQAWSAAQLAAGVAELASRPDAIGPDKDVAFALREPVGAAQRRIWWSKRLRRWLPGVWRRMAAGDLTERHVTRLVEVTAGVNDPELMAKVEERVLAAPAGKTADELARVARDALKRLDPAGSQRRAKQARDQADVEFYPDPDGDGMGDVVIHARSRTPPWSRPVSMPTPRPRRRVGIRARS